MFINRNYSIIFLLFCGVLGLPFIGAAPAAVKDDPFDKFIDFLVTNSCSMPSAVALPFSADDQSPFSYLSTPLKECQSTEAVKPNNKVNLLCKELFDVLQNITCSEFNVTSELDTNHLSANVCTHFAAIQNIIPKKADYLSNKLGDSIICKVLCAEKYQLLCKTLLWSYDTQEKLRKASDPLPVVNENTSNAAPNGALEEGVVTQAENNEISDKNPIPNPKENPQKSDLEPTSKELESKPTVAKDKTVPIDDVKNNSPLPDTKEKKLNDTSQEKNIINSPETPNHPGDTNTANKNDPNQDVGKNPLADQDLNPLDNVAHKKEKIEDKSKNVEDPSTDSNQKVNDKITPQVDINGQNKESNASSVTLPKNGNKIDNKEKIKSAEEPEVLTSPKPEANNDLGNDYQEQENEIDSEKKLIDSNTQVENSKENGISDAVTSKSDKGSSEPTLFPNKNEDMEQHPEVKDPDQYNDSENDGDYAKPEYDNGSNPSLKKDPDIKPPLDDGLSQLSSRPNMQISPEDLSSHGLDISRNYLPGRSYLPEQEDGHFFFYFLSIVLILMAGYLIFHNKQKIIALIVEGRHERRRRSHGAGYKKLETK